MSRHFRIDDVLNDDELREFEQLAAERATTLDALHVWLRSRGKKISRGATYNWRREFRRRAADPIRRMRAELHLWVDRLSDEQLAEACATRGLNGHFAAVIQG